MSLPVLARHLRVSQQWNHIIESENDTALCCSYSTSTLSVSFALLVNVSSRAAISKKAFTFFRLFFNSIWKETRKVVFFSSFRFSSLYWCRGFYFFLQQQQQTLLHDVSAFSVSRLYNLHGTGAQKAGHKNLSHACCSVVRILMDVNGMMVLNRIFKLSFERSWRRALRHSHIEAEINHLNY